MTKKILLINFSIIILLIIFMILIAPVFVPNGVFISGTTNPDVPGHWISDTLKLSDINLIVYFSIVTILCIAYLTKIAVLIKKNKKIISEQLKFKTEENQFLIAATILTIITVFCFLFGILVTPYVLASLREPLVLAEGEKLIILDNPEINNIIYYLILMPVFIAIFPLVYIITISIYLEVLKRIKEKNERKE